MDDDGASSAAEGLVHFSAGEKKQMTKITQVKINV